MFREAAEERGERKGRGRGGSRGSHLTADPQPSQHKQPTRQARQSGKAVGKPVSLAVSDTHGAPGWSWCRVTGAGCRCQCRVRVSRRWRWCKFSVLGFWFSGCGHKLSQTKSFVPFQAKRARDAAGCDGAAGGAARGAKTEAEAWVFSLGRGSSRIFGITIPF